MRRMVEVFHEAGLPPGVASLPGVNGRGAVTGNALVSHPDIDMIGFTGGTTTGRMIASTAGRNLKPIALELGGKSANIITESADLDRALDGALAGIFGNNGQQCLAGSRILVQRSVADRFIEQFVERARRIRLGDPMQASTEIGPLAFRQHMDRVLSYVEVAKADGAKLPDGRTAPPSPHAAGSSSRPPCWRPTTMHASARKNLSGRSATFLTFDTLDEAIAISNASKFGLVNYVWSEDLKTVMRCSRDIRAGTVWVNTPMMRELRAPFGGFKESGIGRDGPTSSADFCTELKATIIPIDGAPMHRFWGLEVTA